MGRVHKKKLAEYNEAAGNDDLNKGKSDTEGDDDEIEKSSARAGQVSVDADGKNAAEDEKNELSSLNEDVESDHKKNGGGKKTTKRKTAEKNSKKTQDVDHTSSDSEDEPLNGKFLAKKGRKMPSAVGKKKLTKGPKSAALGKGKPNKQRAENADSGSDLQEKEYEVKDIVDHKVERGVSYFLIRWEGYTKDDDTWEPENTLSCPDLIAKYKKKKPVAKAGNISNSPVKKNRSTKSVAKDDPSKEWEVEKIIDYAEEKNGRIFRIRWKGFRAKNDTWEPEENLCCDEIIEKFMKRMKTQENVSFKELRVGTKKPKRLVNETALRTNYHNPIGRKSKRAVSKKRVYYGDSDA